MSQYLIDYANRGMYTMQGRLVIPEGGLFQSFPREGWRLEIQRITEAGLRGIEWIYDTFGAGANPLETVEGRHEMRCVLDEYSVSVTSICADYFMDRPLLRCCESERLLLIEKLKWLLGICPEMGIARVVLPFVDYSKIKNKKEIKEVVDILHLVLPEAEKRNIEIHLETDLSPVLFAQLLSEVGHPLVKVNYDSGNSASLGYSPIEEFSAYGKHIGSFHIKDRVLGGGTVPLGQGDVEFSVLRQLLIDFDYQGDFVLQVARGESGDELAWLSHISALAADWLCGRALVESE